MKKIHTNVIKQLAELLNQLSSQNYSQSLCVLNGSSIGQHTRHIIEFYQCLLKGHKSGVIDYDARERNFLLENDLSFTLQTIEDIVTGIEAVSDIAEPLLLAVSYEANHKAYIDTSFMRELVYLIEHSIHHYALIRIGLQENFKEVVIPENFGVAYSTIQYREEQFG
ncbi:DinB family protein [Emticicia sp. BO119]|uniref:DinB family protein n=1 Tax=Emticicia sp. BO119 TaxID=2757768 RepID=UPI0015F053AA|nr:DinB family protein [Emticicia sp. BO119]MBA4849260.1 DinB family protein [Emticicia sp. BO119]